MSWKDSVIDWFDGFGWLSLAALSFTEAIIQPVPPDLLFLPMLVNASGDSNMVLWLWIVITVTSVLGSIIGYWVGRKWGRSLFNRFKGEKHLRKIEALTTRYGTVGVFIAAFSPIPYKVFGWAAGMGEMKMKPFIVAGLFGRGLRFGLEALLVGIYGNKAVEGLEWLLDREVLIGVVIILLCGIAWLLLRWWNELSIDPNIDEQ
ncbi:MAG: hypothetical protein CMB54_03230 [Euryarchaeota archaeon]|nr:hypothetical protein [Euryarchaeota archaeon]